MNQEVHVVAGPTAAGKTKFALELAAKLNGELINADSRQIYKYLDIGTNKGNVFPSGKIQLKEQELPVFNLEDSGINIHLLSFLSPDQMFSAVEFQRLVYEIIDLVLQKDKVPILVGGTGFYIDAVVNPGKYSAASVYHQSLIREELVGLSVKELQGRLPRQVIDSMNNSDKHNPRRLVSRIAAAAAPKTDKVEPPQYPTYNFIKHYVTAPIAELTPRINNRVLEMWQQGLVAEVEQVLSLDFDANVPGLSASGYPFVVEHIYGELAESKCIQKIQVAHRQVAKKQITWFEKYF